MFFFNRVWTAYKIIATFDFVPIKIDQNNGVKVLFKKICIALFGTLLTNLHPLFQRSFISDVSSLE